MKTLQTICTLIFLPSFILLLGSCASTHKMIQRGQYDAAIAKSKKRLLKKKQKQQDVLALEEAFRKATDRDMNEVLKKAESQNIEDLEDVLNIAYKVKRRQEKIEPLLPLTSDKEGYNARFQFVKIGEIIDDLEQRLFDRYTEEGKSLIAQGKTGNKAAARKSYDYFSKAQKLVDHPAIQQYQDSAYHYGVTRISVDITNVSNAWIGQYLEDYMHLDLQTMNSFWTNYYLDPGNEIMDYRVDAVIQSVDISPERMNERIYQDRREIEEGWAYVLDDNGNVAKDSLGNDIKVPKKIWVAADVIELLQEKELYIRGALDVFDVEGRLVDSRPFEVLEEFAHYSSTFRGDRRALSRESKRKIGDRPITFPNDQQMIIAAIKKLSPAIHDQLRKRRWAI